jgi:S-formylglutathione hydrolase FrmB
MLVYGSSDTDAVGEAHRYAAAMAAVGQQHETVVLTGSYEWAVWDTGLTRCLPYLVGESRVIPERSGGASFGGN